MMSFKVQVALLLVSISLLCACTERPPIPKGPQQLPSRSAPAVAAQEEGDEEKDTGDTLPMFRCDGDNNLKTEGSTRVATVEEQKLLQAAKKSTNPWAAEEYLSELWKTCKSLPVGYLIRKARIQQGGQSCVDTRNDLKDRWKKIVRNRDSSVQRATLPQIRNLLDLANTHCPE